MTARKIGGFARHDPKPCPVCYAPMRSVLKGVYYCVKHGAPPGGTAKKGAA